MLASLATYKKTLEKSPDFLRLFKCRGNAALPFPSSALIPASCMAKRPTVLILPSPREAKAAWKGCLDWWEGKEEEVALLPTPETLPFEQLSPRPQTVSERYRVLRCLYKPEKREGWGEIKVLICSVRSLLQPLTPLFKEPPFFVGIGEKISQAGLSLRLSELGYRQTEIVSSRGEMAKRKDILDVFAPNMDAPVRIFWEKEKIGKIRKFSILSQLTFASEKECHFGPVHSFLITEEVREMAKELSHLPTFSRLLEKVSEGKSVNGMEAISSLLPFSSTLSSLLSGFLFLFSDFKSIEKTAFLLREASQKFLESQKEEGLISPGFSGSGLLDFETLKREIIGEDTVFAENKDSSSLFKAHQCGGREEEIKKALDLPGFKVLISSVGGQAEKICSHFSTLPLTAARSSMESGFKDEDAKFAIFTEDDLFGQSGTALSEKLSFREKSVDIPDLNPGDFVVHIQHGIGIFSGLEKRQTRDGEKEFIALQYASSSGKDPDRLYLPVSQLSQISKYMGSDSPKLDRLGSPNWNSTRSKARKHAAEVSAELVKLYRNRRSIKGYAFPQDTPDQKAMEKAFPYRETPDQLKAIEEVKKDMESPFPMDRLITGDVGFGKTEIAIRAAFKAVQGGKQVALLVPTTLLSEQHLETFRSRFAPFGMRVEALSRFRSAKESRKIAEGVRTGEVNVLIGTQKILSPSLSFRELGLVIIDEEQRFGVKDKEFLKKIKPEIDVLSLSATPIPRTLEMSLVGVREVSTLMTPPEERMEVLTYVGKWSQETVAAAISREILRSGQVFYVCGRIEDLDSAAVMIREAVPGCRVAQADGKMPAARLDKVVNDFWKGESDVLVSTSIIELGLDIPRVNTLIVERSDCFGLAQLHQLRGRVGRSSQRAYAYFLHPENITSDSRSRLETIEENTELGSGYKIALKDLELRGIGNLVGEEQSGFIKGVGFDYFVRLMKEGIEKEKGEKQKAKERSLINLSGEAFIPDSFISSQKLRMEAYSSIFKAEGEKELEEVERAMQDRYGRLPKSVIPLFLQRQLEWEAEKDGVKGISQRGENVFFSLSSPLPDFLQMRLKRLFPRSAYLKSEMSFKIPLDKENAESGVINAAFEVLDQLFTT